MEKDSIFSMVVPVAQAITNPVSVNMAVAP
jgi:hypothetical protein